MKRKTYLEITNDCNLACSFCHGTGRPKRYMSESEFRHCVNALKGVTDYLYFHLMGEPLLHPELCRFLEIAAEAGQRVIITTNGSLLRERGKELVGSPGLFKVSISLHAYEVNVMDMTLDEYLDSCFDFCTSAAQAGIIAVMRLWNKGGEDKMNAYILDRMHKRFSEPWKELYSGYKVSEYIFLEWGERFEWPDEKAEERGVGHSCYGVRSQIGVLCDGTVVPCCLDADGSIPLGNIFDSSIEEILSCKRAKELKASFEKGCVSEELCRRCDYAMRKFSRDNR